MFSISSKPSTSHVRKQNTNTPSQWSFAGFEAIAKYTRVGSGYSSITDVNAPNGGDFTNFQESFFFAEVLKYAYLIHADQDAEFQVAGPDGKNTWVFNTEAHPVRVSI
jgi:mannosyl-oligosaccharide alpha-1,2-mannosidase